VADPRGGDRGDRPPRDGLRAAFSAPQALKMPPQTCKQSFRAPKARSQPARQGLAVLMATAVVVLKHETSTTYQSNAFQPRVSATLRSLVEIVPAVLPHLVVKYTGSVPFIIFVFIFLYSLYPCTDFNNGSKDAD